VRLPPLATVAVTFAAAGLLGSCGDDVPAVSELCLEDPAPIEAALREVGRGAAVALEDGTSIAECVERSTSDAQLQSIGLTLTAVADHLVGPVEAGDTAAARRLGFLVGATRRGAARTNGTHLELARRISLVAGRLDLPDEVGAALQAGLAEGERSG
jgi:hypothetical protein